MPKRDFQKEMSKLMDQLKINFQRFSKDAGVIAKKGEKEIVRASKVGRVQLDMMGLNLQKEKLYYDIGKKVATLKNKEGKLDNLDIVDPYFQKLRKIEVDMRGKKKEIARVRRESKKK